MRLTITALSLLILLHACTNIQKKIDSKSLAEQNRLSVYIGKNIEEAFIDFGQPFTDGLNEQGFREVVFQKTKLGVKCSRVFTVDKVYFVETFLKRSNKVSQLINTLGVNIYDG